MDLGVAGADDCRVQHNDRRRRPKVGHRRQTHPEISENSALVKDRPVMTSQAKKANDKPGQFALGRSRNTLTKSAPKTIRSMRRCKSASSFYVSFSRGGLRDNIGRFKDDLFPGLWDADLYCKLLLAETFGRLRKDRHDKCRTDCQDLWA